ncbi:hypothetical protein [Helicobacter suis]|uniref:hypothetical protein n=1 Tax=Helicobacter suis TaxID=104628 RepID=UPI0013D65FDD|nr:hypothetical protein [Helicobacter suis]
MFNYYEGITTELRGIQQKVLEAASDAFGHNVSTQEIDPMLEMCHRLEECEYNANMRHRQIENALDVARNKVRQAR